MQLPEKPLHSTPCNALQRFLERGLGAAVAPVGRCGQHWPRLGAVRGGRQQASLDAVHRWNLSPKRAAALQNQLRARVRIEPPGPIQVVAGIDCAFGEGRVFALAVVWDLGRQAVLETRALSRPLTFPYVPGLLSFREAPALLALLRRVRTPFDALLCDGQGLAHPRRFGLACHLGVLLDKTAVGCAKSRLVGEWREPAAERGSTAPLNCEAEQVGTVLRTRTGVKPLFVSPGHKCDHQGAVALTLRCGGGYRLPEPLRLADRWVAQFKGGRRVF